MRKSYTVIKKINSTEVEDGYQRSHPLTDKKGKTFKASRLLLSLVLMLIIYPYPDKTQSATPPPPDGCGAHTSFLLVGDSLMISHQLLTGATNYSLKLRKIPDGQWIEPIGDVASGCSRINYFVIYLRNKPNDCQKLVLQPGDYVFKITAYDDLIADSCTMDGNFYLTAEQVWKSTYSSWDVINDQNVPVLKK